MRKPGRARRSKTMAFEYKDADFDKKRCKAAVAFGGRRVDYYQCTRRPWKDGWCKQHHPDTVAARDAAALKRYQEETAHRKAAYDWRPRAADWLDSLKIGDGDDVAAATREDLDTAEWLAAYLRRLVAKEQP